MSAIEEIIDLLKIYNGSYLKKSDFKKLDISDYYVKLLLSKDAIRREKHGLYVVLVDDKKFNLSSFEKNKRYSTFSNFKYSVLTTSYVSAYRALIKNLDYQIDDRFSEHNLIYFTLLKELLSSDFNFSIINKLSIDEYKVYEEEYYKYYILFRDNVLTHNYEEALHNLNIFKAKEMKQNNVLSDSTIVFEKLLKDVIYVKKNFNPDDNLYKMFKNNISSGNIYRANLCLNLFYNKENKKFVMLLLTMMNRINDFKINENVIEKRNIKYDDIPLTKLFGLAMNNGDYHKAYETAILLSSKDRKYFIFKDMLDALFTVSSINEMKSKKHDIKYRKESTIMNDYDLGSYYYKHFKEFFKRGEYEEALKYLEESMKYSFIPTISSRNRNLHASLSKLVSILKNGENLKVLKDNYGYYPTDFDKLYACIRNDDFLNAKKYLDIIKSKGVIFKNDILESILDMIYDIHKNDYKLDDYIVKEEKEVVEEEKEETVEEVKEEIKPIKEVKKVKPEVKEKEYEPLTANLLYELVFNQKYEEAYDRLKIEVKKDADNRTFFFASKLISQLFKLENETFEDLEDKTYKKNEEDVIGRFYEALRLRDYENACFYGKKASKKVDNSFDFEVWLLILEDMIPLYNGYIYRKGIFRDIKEIDKNTKQVFSKKISEFTDVDIYYLRTNIRKKVELLSSINRNHDEEDYLLNIMDLILLNNGESINYSLITDSSFADLNNYPNGYSVDEEININEVNQTNSEIFEYGIKYGEYQKLKKLLDNYDNMNSIKDHHFLYLVNVYKLICYLYIKNRIKEIPKQEEQVVEENKNNIYAYLKKQVKTRHYEEAMKTVMENSSLNDPDIIANILLILSLHNKEADQLLLEIDKISDDDLKTKYEKVRLYCDYIKDNYMSRDISSYEEKLEEINLNKKL